MCECIFMVHVCDVTGRLYFKTPYALPTYLSPSLSSLGRTLQLQPKSKSKLKLKLKSTRVRRARLSPAPQPRLGKKGAGGTTSLLYVLSFRIKGTAVELSLSLPCIVAQNCGGCKKG